MLDLLTMHMIHGIFGDLLVRLVELRESFQTAQHCVVDDMSLPPAKMDLQVELLMWQISDGHTKAFFQKLGVTAKLRSKILLW